MATGLHTPGPLTKLSSILNTTASEIHAAAVKGDVRKIKTLLGSAHLSVNTRDEKGRTPLHCAANYDRGTVVQLLLDSGGDVNAREESGRTALQLVSYFGYLAVAELLLRKGADVNLASVWGVSPLHLAANYGHQDSWSFCWRTARTSTPAITEAKRRC